MVSQHQRQQTRLLMRKVAGSIPSRGFTDLYGASVALGVLPCTLWGVQSIESSGYDYHSGLLQPGVGRWVTSGPL